MLLAWGFCQSEYPKSAVVVGLLHNSFKNLPSLGTNEFLADGPDWHLRSKAGVRLSLITCGDVCSDTLQLHGFDSCGEGAEEDAVGFAKTFPEKPCVSQITWRPVVAARHSQRMA